jgi:hypothetical protein
LAITQGRLKVSGRAPDGLTWEGPFGVIEKPLPLSSARPDDKTFDHAVPKEPFLVREERASYGSGSVVVGPWEVIGLDARSLDHDRNGNEIRSDHMISTADLLNSDFRFRVHSGGGETIDGARRQKLKNWIVGPEPKISPAFKGTATA